MWFFDSYIGRYVLESISHSLITLFIIEMSLRIWHVENASERFRYRLLILILPFFMFHVFQLINPERGSFYFVEDAAFFSGMRWLELRLWGRVSLSFLFLFVVLATSAIAVIQEVAPIIRDIISKSGGYAAYRDAPQELRLMLEELSRNLGVRSPSVRVIDDESPLIFTVGAGNSSIVVSNALLETLDKRQLKSALAHELAHIVRRSNTTTLFVFVMRIFMFYNPVSLLVFRRLVQDDEHICDDITVSMTKDPDALASALRVFYLDIPQKDAHLREVIESSSHNLLLRERIIRLEDMEDFKTYPSGFGKYLMTLAVILTINYFVV